MLTVYLIMIIPLTLYLAFIVKKYGVQPSISESFYRLKGGWEMLFTLALWSYALPAIILGVEYSALAFLAGVGLALVGASPMFKGNKMESTAHSVGAVTAAVGGVLWMLFVGLWWLAIAVIVVNVLMWLLDRRGKIKNLTWWAELTVFVSYAIGSLIINFL